jgi:hypothetical protein
VVRYARVPASVGLVTGAAAGLPARAINHPASVLSSIQDGLATATSPGAVPATRVLKFWLYTVGPLRATGAAYSEHWAAHMAARTKDLCFMVGNGDNLHLGEEEALK